MYEWKPVSHGHNIIQDLNGRTVASLDMFLGHWRMVMAANSYAKHQNDLLTFEFENITANAPAPFELAMNLFILAFEE